MAFFECTKCEKSYKNKGSLAAHQRMHDGTAFVCDLCEKRFDKKSGLERHRVAHTFDKPYACDVDGCETKFTQKGRVQWHKRTVHEKVHTYVCEQCERRFHRRDNLKMHYQIHTERRPYGCTQCAKKFLHKNNLQDHYDAVHTSERLYACVHCEKTFAKASACRRHKRRVHI